MFARKTWHCSVWWSLCVGALSIFRLLLGAQDLQISLDHRWPHPWQPQRQQQKQQKRSSNRGPRQRQPRHAMKKNCDNRNNSGNMPAAAAGTTAATARARRARARARDDGDVAEAWAGRATTMARRATAKARAARRVRARIQTHLIGRRKHSSMARRRCHRSLLTSSGSKEIRQGIWSEARRVRWGCNR